ncbi:hypothetical protein EMIHUDRAFT_443803, partial [Emiliania huxleyi CCMP1516]
FAAPLPNGGRRDSVGGVARGVGGRRRLAARVRALAPSYDIAARSVPLRRLGGRRGGGGGGLRDCAGDGLSQAQAAERHLLGPAPRRLRCTRACRAGLVRLPPPLLRCVPERWRHHPGLPRARRRERRAPPRQYSHRRRVERGQVWASVAARLVAAAPRRQPDGGLCRTAAGGAAGRDGRGAQGPHRPPLRARGVCGVSHRPDAEPDHPPTAAAAATVTDGRGVERRGGLLARLQRASRTRALAGRLARRGLLLSGAE